MPIEKAFYPKYGDNRKNLYEVHDPQVHEVAKSVCCFVRKENIEFDPEEKIYKISKNVESLSEYYFNKFAEELKEKYPHEHVPLEFAKGQKFLGESHFAFGSGFLVTSNKIMTAHHVIDGEDLDEIFIVFDFVMKNRKEETQTFPERNVFKIKSVWDSARNCKKGFDWAIVEIEETGRNPLKLNTSERIFSNYPNSLRMLGHPLGLPLKYVKKGKVTYYNSKIIDHVFKVKAVTNRFKNTFPLKIAAFHGNLDHLFLIGIGKS